MDLQPTKRRGRPLKSEEAQFHDELLDHVLGRFKIEGYRASTMASIAASFGAAKSTLYRKFGSKAGLLLAAMERAVPVILGPLEQVPADSGRPLEDVLRDFGKIIQDHHSDPGIRAMWHAVSEARDDLGPFMAEAMNQQHLALGPIENYLIELVRADRIKPINPRIAAASFTDLVSGGLHAFLVREPEGSERTELLEFGIDLFLRGIVKTGDRKKLKAIS